MLLILIFYLIGAYFLYEISKEKSTSYPWFAWIPILSTYNMFEIMNGEEFEFTKEYKMEKKLTLVIYILFPILVQVLANTSYCLGVLGQITYLAFSFFVYQNFYKALELKNALVYAVLTLLVKPIMLGIAWNDYKNLLNKKNVVEQEENKENTINEEQTIERTGDDV